MILPDESVKWIKLHRTHLSGDIKREYEKDVQNDFDLILPHLPKRLNSIVDIGCGMAGIDVLLAKKYPQATITLLDGDGPESNFRGGYGAVMEPFNSRDVVNEIFRLNDLAAPRWLKVWTKDAIEADLVLSLLSWGYHYPLSTYKAIGLCIADLRKKFPVLGTLIVSTNKYNRCIWASSA